jgi:hypothetical protein
VAGGCAAGSAAEAAAAEPPVGEEELRHVIERTAAGSVIWAAVRGMARLEALLLPVPLMPDPTESRGVDVSIGDAGAERLAARLEAFPQLRVLELPGNRIGAVGMTALDTSLEAGACPGLVKLRGVGRNALSLFDAARGGHEGAVRLLLRSVDHMWVDERLAVGGEAVYFATATFGLQATRLEAPVAAVAVRPVLADAELTNVAELAGKVAVVRRGGCPF